MLALPLALAGCFGSDGDRPTLMDGTQAGGPQPFPDNFRGDMLALMRSYLNNPVGVRDAAWPSRCSARSAAGCSMSAACTSPHARSDGTYSHERERAVIFVDGRADRVVDNASEPCAGAVYVPFPELEKMTR